MTSKYKLLIADMHCGACVRRVTSALEAVGGVSIDSVEVGSAEIVLDSEQASIANVASTLDRIGFHATLEP